MQASARWPRDPDSAVPILIVSKELEGSFSPSSRTILNPPDGRIHVKMGQISAGVVAERYNKGTTGAKRESAHHVKSPWPVTATSSPYNPFSTARMSSFVGRTL